MTPEQLKRLRKRNASAVQAIRLLLHEYRTLGDGELADFVENYTYALELDFELAAAQGETGNLELIVEDVRELLDDTCLRVNTARALRRTSPPLVG